MRQLEGRAEDNEEGAARPVLPVISYFSRRETQKIVLNIRISPICTGTTGHARGVRASPTMLRVYAAGPLSIVPLHWL